MQITVSDVVIQIQKKNIKNLHLNVKPPEGRVVISAPQTMNEKAIEAYARTNLSWIRKQKEKFSNQSRSDKRQYVSGETMYIWGKQYYMVFVPNNKKNSFLLKGDTVVLSMNEKSSVKQREIFVREQYRKILKKGIEKRLPKWENITGLRCDAWQTRYMTTRWGTCNTEKKKIWFNLQLAQKPTECLDYVIVHELLHLLTRKHDASFIQYMDHYMPNWREIRNELNSRRLDYYEFRYDDA